VSRYQKGKTNLDFTEARDNEWQWRPLGHMQVCTMLTLLQIDNHASTLPVSFLQAGCPSCRPTNSIKALKGAIKVQVSPFIGFGQLDKSANISLMDTKGKTAITLPYINPCIHSGSDQIFLKI